MSILRGRAEQAVVPKSSRSEDASVDKEQKFADRELEAFAIHNKGLGEFYFHRKSWSWFILGWISCLILFNIGLTFCVGRQWLNFDNIQWFVASVTAETFIQIVGLGYIAARYLFPIDTKEP